MGSARTIPATDRLVSDEAVIRLAPEEQDGKAAPRKFSMLAYTGAVVKRFWGDLVIDLEGIKIGAQRKPILLGHDDAQRAGYSESIKRTEKGIEIEGCLLDNEVGNAVYRDAKQGFPFQASVGIAFDDLEDVPEGKKASCNGKTLKGPVTVARRSRLLESSWVAIGADQSTSAEALAQARNKGGTHMADEVQADAPAAVQQEAPKADTAPEAPKADPSAALLALVESLKAELSEVKAKLAAPTEPRKVEVVPFSAAREHTAPPKVDLNAMPTEKRAKYEFENDKGVSEEFESHEDYAAFLRAMQSGRVRIMSATLPPAK